MITGPASRAIIPHKRAALQTRPAATAGAASAPLIHQQPLPGEGSRSVPQQTQPD
jgi:hypothetical protein